jgi:NNP family nitrate/nitrite transporter-like MFS transporter
MRPVGGWLSRQAGRRPRDLLELHRHGRGPWSACCSSCRTGAGGNFTGFFMMLHGAVPATGIGNGSTFRMIPVIFLTERQRAAAKTAAAQAQAVKDANKEAAAVLGFTSAIGAYGGFFIPKSYGTSIAMTGSPDAALYAFIAFYLTASRSPGGTTPATGPTPAPPALLKAGSAAFA